MNPASPNWRKTLVIAGAWVVFAIVAVTLALQNLSTPGLYYDEAVFGGLAKDFLTGHHRLHTPGFEIVNFLGRPFPVFVQFYLGALKCWIFVPAFAVFGPTVATLRLTTLGCGLLALLFFMLGVRRWLGLRASLVAGVVLILDPTYFFVGVLDWGAAITALLCRCAAFYLTIVWWQNRKARYLFCAGLFLGLGLFNKVDFAAVLIGVAISALYFFGRDLWSVFRAQPSSAAIGSIGFFLGAGPMILKLPRIVSYTAAGQGTTGPGELNEKLHTFVAMYDGSYFYRLMSAGGLFDQMYQRPSGVQSLLWLILPIAIVALFASAIRTGQNHQLRVGGFLVLSCALTTVALFLTPGAIRIHHAILAFPFPQVIISAAFKYLWDLRSTIPIRNAVRAASITAILVLLGSEVHAIAKTERLLRDTGGSGRWSNAFDRLCREIKDRSDVVIASLDWGFSEQLAFLTDEPKLVEPFWAFPNYKNGLPPLPRQPQYIYLAHPPEYSLFRYDVLYLDALQSAGEGGEIQPYFDRQGRIAFYAIRFRGE